MKFTGERMIPGQVPEDLEATHKLRYSFAIRNTGIGTRTGSYYVLDAPCGVGYGADMIAAAGANAFGIDTDEESVEYAREHYGRKGRDGLGACSFAAASIESAWGATDAGFAPKIEFAIGSYIHGTEYDPDAGFAPKIEFDLVVCFEGIEHVDQDAGARWLKAFYDFLKPGGVLLVSSPHPNTSKSGGGGFHKREYFPAELRAIVEGSGFRVFDVYQQARNPNLPILRALNPEAVLCWDGDSLIGHTIVRGVKP